MSTSTSIDIQTIRKDILDPSRTASVVRAMLPPSTLKSYMDGAQSDFQNAPRTKDKPDIDQGPDRVLPWVWDNELKTFTVHRLYRFLHNEAGTTHGSVHQEIMDIRDQVESAWPNRDFYTKNGLRNIHIIAKYEHHSAGYHRHTDDPIGHTHPLLQCWVQLSQPGKDFSGGDLILYPPGGGQISAINDLNIQAGDAIFFDKRTEHEVLPCGRLENGRGRWIAIVGAMAPMQQPKDA